MGNPSHKIWPTCSAIEPARLVLGFLFGIALFSLISAEDVAQKNVSQPTHGDPELAFIHSKLSMINKPAVKSIQSEDGDIIDCVPIENQPAFDHPLLKDHKIQARPASLRLGRVDGNKVYDEGSGRNASSFTMVAQVWRKGGEHCPLGTVPIRRTSLADVQRAPSPHKFGQKLTSQIHTSLQSAPSSTTSAGPTTHTHAHAIAYVSGEAYYGSTATINVWDPWVENPLEFSLSQMWVISGAFDSGLNTIEAGWQVSPELYGDKRPRFFIYWTADYYQQTGCYNLLCSGFVQTSNEIAMGASISPWSIYGSSQYDIKILIWKDPEKGDWWLEFGDSILVGYWPAKLFTHLKSKATTIEWGGEVAQVATPFRRRHTGTQMGSGRFAQEGFRHASYFRNVEVVNSNNQLKSITKLYTSVDQPHCYNIRSFYNSNWGNFFYFGGPGRNPLCP